MWEFKCNACGVEFKSPPYNLVRCPNCEDFNKIKWVKELEEEGTDQAKKKLNIYIEEETKEYVVERTNEFAQSFKRKHISEEGLFETLSHYVATGEIDKYELEVDQNLFAKVVNFLNK